MLLVAERPIQGVVVAAELRSELTGPLLDLLRARPQTQKATMARTSTSPLDAVSRSRFSARLSAAFPIDAGTPAGSCAHSSG